MKAIIRIDVPEWQIGQEGTIYFPDTMQKKGTCELLNEQNYIPVSWLEQYTRLKCTESWHNMAIAIIKTWQETNKKHK